MPVEYLTASGLHVVEHRQFIPNDNDPATHPPATVGPPTARPGDPNGFEIIDEARRRAPVRFRAAPAVTVVRLAGRMADPELVGPRPTADRHRLDVSRQELDRSSRRCRPYLVGAAPSLSADWLINPDPDLYGSWNEFAKQLWWDYQAAGEAFVLVTARYATDWPARFHVVPPYAVEADIDGAGDRRYTDRPRRRHRRHDPHPLPVPGR